MFTKWLIKFGVIATPFFVIAGYDIRDIKLDIAGMVALAIGLSAIYEYGIKPYRNKWLMIFLWVACSCYFLAPHSPVQMFRMDVTLFWVWKPMYYFVVFGLMLFSVSSIDFKKTDIDKIIRMVTWCGFIMGGYTILQFFKLDQFFRQCTDGTYGHMAGFIGNPTHVAPYIAMIVPICFYMRHYAMAMVMVLAICVIQSQVAIGALILALLFYLMTQSRRGFLIGLEIIIIVCAFIVIGTSTDVITREMFEDNERLMMWTKIIKDLVTPQLHNSAQIYPLTGLGLGTFKYVFHFQHQNSFWQAHNEYVELLYNLGIGGLSLFFGSIFLFFKRNFHISMIFDKNRRTEFYGLRTTLIASIICIFITAGGTFIFQIGTTAWYSVLILGLLSNQSIGGTA